MIKLKYIAFEITNSCNLDCVYCYNIWKSGKVKGVPFNSYLKAIKTLEKLFSIAEIEYITFTGGEPFLADRFNEVVLYCIMAGKKVSIISNGTQLNHQRYKELIKLGVELFEFPIHCLKPEIHDKMVQLNGSWKKSTTSIKKVQELGGKVVPVIVITKHNVNQIAETLDFIASLGCNRIMLNRYNIGGNGCENPLEISATAEELRHAFYIANEKANKLNLKITANVCTPICLLNPSDYPSIGFGHCSFNVLERPITLDINGNIRLCNHSPIVAGNIYETELSKILYSEYTTEWETSIPEFCKPCSQWSTCKGGCRAATEQCKGRLDIEDPIIKALNVYSNSIKINWIYLLENESFFNQLFSTHYPFSEKELINLHLILSFGNSYLTIDSGAIQCSTTFGLIYNKMIKWSKYLKELYYVKPRLLWAGGGSDEYSDDIDFDNLPLNINYEIERIISIETFQLLSGYEYSEEEGYLDDLPFEIENIERFYTQILEKTEFTDIELTQIIKNKFSGYIINVNFYMACVELIKKSIPNFSIINFYEKLRKHTQYALSDNSL